MRRVVSFVVAIAFLAVAAPVHADPSTTSRLSWVTNGDVQAAVQVGNTLYVGGTFTRVAPASGALGSFFGVSTVTGEPLPAFPLVDGVVHAIEPDGAGGYYIGGAFTKVGGEARTNLAHVLVGGTVDPAFAPTISGGPVRSLALGSSFLFVGGRFNTINGAARPGFATVNPTTGATIVLSPPAFADVFFPHRTLIAGANVIVVMETSTSSARVHAFNHTTGAAVWSTTLLGITNDAIVAGTRLIVGGRLLQADGRTVASLDLATGAVDPAWTPNVPPPIASADAVNTLGVVGTTLYVGGTFSTFGGQPRANAAAVDIATGVVTAWAPDPNGAISALAATLTGNIVLSGRFTQVDGESRDTFAEVDASGNATTLITEVQAGLVQAMRLDVAGNLVVGGLAGVTDGSPRTNLAAFDLSSDTLLPWAPAMSDSVTALGTIGSTIYVGASQLVSSPTPVRLGVVAAVHAVSGAPILWTPPESNTGITLLGTHGSHVYVSGSFGLGSLRRLDATTAAVDPGWRPLVGTPTHMVISGGTMFVAGSYVAAVDLATGTISSSNPVLFGGLGVTITVKALAVHGRSVYVAYRRATVMGSVTHHVDTFDAVSGLRTGPLSFGSGYGPPETLAVADGQVIAARAVVTEPFLESVGRVQAIDANGLATPWNPDQIRADAGPTGFAKPGLLVTPTDVVVLGYYGTAPMPVQGIAVFPRNPSAAPTNLRATTVDNQVSLTWDAPNPPSANEYALEVAAFPSAFPLTLLTGSNATSVNGVAGNGTYYVRARSSGAPAGPASLPTNEIALVVGCSATATSPPLGLAAQVSGSHVTLSWSAPPFSSLSGYVLEAGSSAGATDIGRFTFPGSQTTVTSAIPPGSYFVRMRTANACSESAPSSEVFFTIGAAATIPDAPTAWTHVSASGFVVALQWTPSPGALGYVLEASRTPGQSDLGTFAITDSSFAASGVLGGVYHVRVRAFNAAGLSAPSPELVVVMPFP